MPVNPTVQAYINIAGAEAANRPGIQTAIQTIVAQIGAWQESIARQTAACNAAMMSETDISVLNGLEKEKQTLGALRREVSEVEKQLADLPKVLRQQQNYQADFVIVLRAQGYPV